jgi:spermidine/putrescine-binding protein
LLGKNVNASDHVPSEGTVLWCDSYAIPKDAPNADAAYAFIDTMMRPKGNAVVATTAGGAVSIEAGVPYLPRDLRELYDYGDLASVFEENQFYTPAPLEPEDDAIASQNDWLKAWDELKLS